jgi:hypothetical protein
MYAWAGNQTQPGRFYRVRYTGRPVHVLVGLNARKNGMTLTFSGPLDPKSAGNPRNYAVQTWSLKRSAAYGSKHYDEKPAADLVHGNPRCGPVIRRRAVRGRRPQHDPSTGRRALILAGLPRVLHQCIT